MRFLRLITAVFLSATLCGSAATSDAGFWQNANPKRCVNYLNRCLGIGWSDGYHAYGSRTSWMPPQRHGHPRYQSNPTMMSPFDSVRPGAVYVKPPVQSKAAPIPAVK